jgi:hypothetical protein
VHGSEMKHRLNNKKNNSIVTAASFLTLAATIILVVAGTTAVIIAPFISVQSAQAQRFIDQEGNFAVEPKAPMAASQDGNNVYVVWWTNRSGNWEVMFRASNDGGATFSEAINLSNSTDAQSQNAEIVAAGESNVFLSWWETNQMNGTSESVMRVSTDAGETFGPLMMLGTNGTISSSGTEEEGEEAEGETVEEEAVGGEEVAQ